MEWTDIMDKNKNVLSELAKARQLVADGKMSIEDFEALAIGYRAELSKLPKVRLSLRRELTGHDDARRAAFDRGVGE